MRISGRTLLDDKEEIISFDSEVLDQWRQLSKKVLDSTPWGLQFETTAINWYKSYNLYYFSMPKQLYQ